MGQIDITSFAKRDFTKPEDLSVDFIKKAYDLVEFAEQNPDDYFDLGACTFLAYGYSLKLVNCKSPTELKQCNLALVKSGAFDRIKSQTYSYKDLDLGILKLCESYIEYLRKDNKI